LSDSTKTPLIKSNALYDTLKHFAMITLPALGTLYFALSQLWGLPHGGEVVGTITAVDTFLGITLHISNQQYQNSDARFDGQITVDSTGKSLMNLDPDAIAAKDEIAVKVTKAS
jgi:hypothetical protein